jgi:hypothetical protein
MAHAHVINIDGFFDDRVTEPVDAILHGDNPVSRHHRKRLWQGPHRALLGAAPRLREQPRILPHALDRRRRSRAAMRSSTAASPTRRSDLKAFG